MARIFLSHSSLDELEAVAVRDWLAENGWAKEDIFLDLDPMHGLVAGERWQKALRQAADRCEAVIFIISPAWTKSKWCLTEYLLAQSLNKRIFGVVLKPIAMTELPFELTAEWQLSYLVGDGPITLFQTTHKGQTHKFEWLTDGLTRLRSGLTDAKIGAKHFFWPPENKPHREPYRGFEPFEEIDVAVYFGRDTQILQGLDMLRGMRSGDGRSLFVILGPSGTGKSSFLRAGLLPRLKLDDRNFFPLQVVRPRSHAITGDDGLANALYNAAINLKLSSETLGNIKKELLEYPDSLLRRLNEIQTAAAKRMDIAGLDFPPPTIILPIDQSEELFQAGTEESDHLLTMLNHCLIQNDYKYPRLIITFTIRSDRYEKLQTAKALIDYKNALFDALKPMPLHCYKEVILGPAVQASKAGNKLEVEPNLVDRLLEDFGKGGDPLPLLSLTLSLLFKDYGSDGDLRLDEYEKLGGMEAVVSNIIDSILSSDVHQRAEQLHHLRSAFIPHLVSIDTQSNQIMRRQAFYDHLPPTSHLLIDALGEKRLLIIDQDSKGTKTVEVTHEAVLRQWKDLHNWLEDERENLKLAQALEQAATEWVAEKDPSWLWHGVRLKAAEELKELQIYKKIVAYCDTFLAESRKQEISELEQKEQQLRQTRKLTRTLIFTVIFLLVIGVWGFYLNNQSKTRNKNIISLSLIATTKYLNLEKAWLVLLAANKVHSDFAIDARLIGVLQNHTNLIKLISIDSPISAIALSPHGTQLLSGSKDGTLTLSDAETGETIAKLETDHLNAITQVAFSPDGTHILAGNQNGTLSLWNIETGRPIGRLLMNHQSPITTVAFSPDGTRILSGAQNGTLRRWNVETGQSIGEPLKYYGETMHPDEKGIVFVATYDKVYTRDPETGKRDETPIIEIVYSIASADFSRDGKDIVSITSNGKLHIWDANTGQQASESIVEHDTATTALAVSPDATQILSRNVDGTLRLLDTKTGQKIGEPFAENRGPIISAAFSSDGRRILSKSEDGILLLWDAKTVTQIGEPLNSREAPVENFAFSRDGTRILSSGKDGILHVWNAQIPQSINNSFENRIIAALSPDATRILSIGEDDALHIRNVMTGEPIGVPLIGHEDSVVSIAFSPDGTRALTGSWDKTLRLWDANTGQPIGIPFKGHEDSVMAVAFSPDGSQILSGCADGTLRLWDSKGQPIGKPFKRDDVPIMSVAFSHDGARILSGNADGTLRLWDSKTGQSIGTALKGHDGSILSVAFSPDDSHIISGSKDRTLRIWITKTGQPFGVPLRGHGDSVRRVTFNPDGTYILSGGDDKTLRLWDAKTGRPIDEPLRVNEGSVTSVAFTPDGTHILAGGLNGALQQWSAPAAWPSELCKKLTRNMSHKEWREWVSPDIGYIKQCDDLPIPPDEPN